MHRRNRRRGRGRRGHSDSPGGTINGCYLQQSGMLRCQAFLGPYTVSNAWMTATAVGTLHLSYQAGAGT